MKRWFLICGVGLLVLCGCGKFFVPNNTTGTSTGTAPTNANAGDVLYLASTNATASSIDAFVVSSAGALTSATNSPYSLSEPPTSMAITPGNTFLYVGSANGILGYSIGTNGALTELNSGAALTTDALGALSMVVDTTGNYLFAAGIDLASGADTPEVWVYQIDTSNGTLAELTASPYAINDGNGSSTAVPTQLYMAPNNAYLYLTLGTGATEVLNFTAADGLTDTGSHINLSTNGTSQNYVVANSTSTILFISETNAGVRVLNIGTDGVPSADISGSPFAAGTGPSGMVLNSAETALYVADKGGAEISGFTVAATGALTALSSSPYPAGTDPLYLTLDSTGNFLAVANIGGTPDLGIYKFDATTTGKLDALTSPSYSTTPAGSFLVIRTFPTS